MTWPVLQTLWRQRSARERGLLALAACVLGTALLWSWGVAPALNTWRSAAQRQTELDQQTRHMLQLQAQAQQLQTPSRVKRAEAIARLESSASPWLGRDARLEVQGDRLRVSLVAAPASGLAQWLAQARESAQALPQSAQLTQLPTAKASTPASVKASGPDTAERDAPEVLWRGELSLRLP